jgi:hypothetical protein
MLTLYESTNLVMLAVPGFADECVALGVQAVPDCVSC